MFAVEIEGLTKTFRRSFRQKPVLALDHLSLQIEPGQIIGYLGQNGAGKTTTFKLLLGFLRPTSGKAWLLGEPINQVRARHRVGFLAEQPRFAEHLTAREFLEFCGSLFRQNASVRRSRGQELLALVGLEDVADVQLRKFSRGMLQRIGVAQALINDPEIVFLDEPTSGLDPIGRKQIRDLIVQLKLQGKTVFYSTHILSDVQSVADQVAVVSRGKLQGFGPLDELLINGDSLLDMTVEGIDAENRRLLHDLASEVLDERDGRLHLRVHNDERLRQAQHIVVSSGAKMTGLTPSSASLEDRFIHLVNGQVEASNTARIGREEVHP